MGRRTKGARAALLRLTKRALRRVVFPARPDPWCEEEGNRDEDGGGEVGSLPEDVTEGPFVVVAAPRDEEPRRFVVSLRCLSQPQFLRLLGRAGEELGFHQQGPLAIPCKSSELERVLGEL